MSRRIYEDRPLYLLCAATWILMIVTLLFLFYDLFKLHFFAQTAHEPDGEILPDNLAGIPNRHGTDIIYRTYISPESGRQNDSDAFAELYTMTYSKVYNYARHYLKDDFLAQDALQDIYILALKNLGKLNDPTLFVARLNRISFNVCYNISLCHKQTCR